MPSFGIMGLLWIKTIASFGTMEVLWVETVPSCGTMGVLRIGGIASLETFEGKPGAADGFAQYFRPDADGCHFAPKGWANSPTFARRRWKRRVD